MPPGVSDEVARRRALDAGQTLCERENASIVRCGFSANGKCGSVRVDAACGNALVGERSALPSQTEDAEPEWEPPGPCARAAVSGRRGDALRMTTARSRRIAIQGQVPPTTPRGRRLSAPPTHRGTCTAGAAVTGGRADALGITRRAEPRWRLQARFGSRPLGLTGRQLGGRGRAHLKGTGAEAVGSDGKPVTDVRAAPAGGDTGDSPRARSAALPCSASGKREGKSSPLPHDTEGGTGRTLRGPLPRLMAASPPRLLSMPSAPNPKQRALGY